MQQGTGFNIAATEAAIRQARLAMLDSIVRSGLLLAKAREHGDLGRIAKACGLNELQAQAVMDAGDRFKTNVQRGMTPGEALQQMLADEVLMSRLDAHAATYLEGIANAA